MDKVWHPQQYCDYQDNPRPLHGTLFLVPKKEDNREESSQFPRSCNYDVWTGPDDTTIQPKIMEDNGQQVLSNAMANCHTSLEDHEYHTKVSRSQSFSENGIKMDYLTTPDPRRFSFASNESGMSSTSSEIWSYDQPERKKNFSQMFQTAEPLQRDSIWGESDFHFSGDKCHSIKENAGYDSHYFNQLTNSIRDSTNFLRRSSGFSSDSDRTSRRTSSITSNNLERRYSRFSTDTSRRDSELSGCSGDRRSSGFVSDFDRRDSSSSNSSIGHFGGYSDHQAAPHVPVVVHPGMDHVPQWLKSLRLHKYTDLVMGMTYPEMVQLTEEKLEHLNVTKGARRKIVASIQKLEERPNTLASIDAELEIEDCDIKKVLVDLESVLKSPIKIEEEENLRSRHDSAIDSGTEVSEDEEQEIGVDIHCSGRKLVDLIMKTLRKACSLILLSQHTDTKNVALLTALLDLCLSRDCYLPRQKQLLISWKQKLYSIWGPLPSPHQTISPKEKPFHLKSPHIPTSTYEPHPGLQPNWAGWSQHNTEDNKERLTVPSAGEPFHQRKDHPFLMPRNSAPNIGSSIMFSSPLSYKKRYSFQDGALSPRVSLQHRNSLPTLEPHLPATVMQKDQQHPCVSRQDSDWRASLNTLGLRFSDLQCGSDTVSEVVDMSNNYASVNGITKEKTPTTILVTQVDSPSDTELNTRLETLCLAVTEQALE
eukprot:TRINITY_DN17954_c0_g1_i1.p1 TRINITY_DN17954_c0_g1~~TRINITY_DN17954_c0_g1_i1.p1  ORF type:complete len:706 (+),score=139.80 TRINITY_DN17954_c0_g1_i1:343-2460(+)